MVITLTDLRPDVSPHLTDAIAASKTTETDMNAAYLPPHEGLYEPASFDSEETFEADIAVPRDFAQHLFGKAYGFLSSMEDRYSVSAAAGSGGSSGGYSADGEIVVTLRVKGSRLSVELFRAKLRTSVHAAEMARIDHRCVVASVCMLLLLMLSRTTPMPSSSPLSSLVFWL